jgi:hypothetical protein
MRLVYKATGQPVKRGDFLVKTGEGSLAGEYFVTDFRPPHKPSSEGKITVRLAGKSSAYWSGEFYVSVFGAEWIEREDRS